MHEPRHRHRGFLSPLQVCIGVFRRDHVTRLILAEPECVAGNAGRCSSTAPIPDAIAISASATRSPPSEMSWTAVTKPSRIRRADELAVAALGGEIDRRRRALLAAANVAQIKRLTEPASRFADQQDRLAFGLESNRHRLGEFVERARRRRSSASARSPGRWSRCRATHCRTRSGNRARGRLRRCRGCSRQAGP